MWEFRDQVAITGIGYTELIRRNPRTLAELTVEATDRALADAGLTRAEIDGLATTPAMPVYGGEKGNQDGVDVMTPGHLAGALGIRDRVTWLGNTAPMVTHAAIDAVNALVAGACTHVVLYRALHMPVGRYSNYTATYAGGKDQFFAPYGFSMPAGWAATVARRYLDLAGASRDALADFVVDNRDNAQHNPHAYFRGKPLSRDEYLGARMIADPITLFDCDLPVDGAVAIVLTRTERARGLRNPPALITGYATSNHVGPTGAPMTLESILDGAAQTGERLWDTTGIGRDEIDNAQLYDGFSIFAFTWLEGLGFVGRGEAPEFIATGRARRTGSLPLNTGGGCLAEGRLHGMTQLTEAAYQVTDRAGERQVPGASRSVVTVSNGLAGSVAFVISRAG
ncbi:thiolase family protein [Nocardia rhamnosiphila]|uniref:thiolase family protein n=1 Tax=Nocardia rhamnosiphila TaxID=426716 RepID=UPI0033E025C3